MSMKGQVCASQLLVGRCSRDSHIEFWQQLHRHPRHSWQRDQVSFTGREQMLWDSSQDLHSMSPYQHGIGIWILLHSFFQTTSQVLLECRVLDDWDLQGIKESQHYFPLSFRNPLDLLNVGDLKLCILAMHSLNQQSHENCPLGVGMYATSRTLIERCQEKRSTLRRLQVQGFADIFTSFWWVLGRGI